MATPWATPKYGNDHRGFPSGLKDGDNTFRILPPMFSLAESGKWAVGHAQHFGYPTKNGEKTQYNPFYCVEKSKFSSGSLVILQECPECVLLEGKQEEYEDAKKALTKAGKSDAEVRAMTEVLSNFVRSHNRDFKWYINVKNLDGTFESKKIPSKVKKAIDKLIADYQKRRMPIDAIAADGGLFFIVHKSGKGLQTEYDVRVMTEEVTRDGETYERPKLAPLSEKDYVDAQEKCRDLTDVGIRDLSLEKVEMLVRSGGDPEVIEAVFKTAERVTERTAPSTRDYVPADQKPYAAPAAEQRAAEEDRSGPGADIQPPAAKASEKVVDVKPSAPAGKTPQEMFAEAQALLAAAKAAMQASLPETPKAAPSSPPVEVMKASPPVEVVKAPKVAAPAAPAKGVAEQDFESFAAGFATE